MSPADCTVLSLGRVSRETLELDQIKGFSYPLNLFTGPRHPFLKKTYQYFEGISFSYHTILLKSFDSIRYITAKTVDK